MLENEAAVYAANDNFDAADDTQLRVDVLKKEINFHIKTFKACHSRSIGRKSSIQFYISRKRFKELKPWKIMQESIMILLDNSEMVIDQAEKIKMKLGVLKR